MALFIFIIAVVVGYLLYTAYNTELKQLEKEVAVASRQSSIDSRSDSDKCLIPNCECKNEKSVVHNFIHRFYRKRDSGNIHSLIHAKPSSFGFRAFVDRFQTIEDVTKAIREAGLKQCNIILGIDFTASNEWQGRACHRGQSLHHIHARPMVQNPYQNVISILNRTLLDIMSDYNPNMPNGQRSNAVRKLSMLKTYSIHAFGFGDSVTKDKDCFSLNPYGPCSCFEEIQKYYKQAATTVVLDGPTSFAPVINKALEIVKTEEQFHVLIIIADGQFVDEGPTVQAIVEASKHPLSIVVIGVGDGPWALMSRFDNWLPQRQFDNFQFVEFTKTMKWSRNAETSFALQVLMEIPDQYNACVTLGYVKKEEEDFFKLEERFVKSSLGVNFEKKGKSSRSMSVF